MLILHFLVCTVIFYMSIVEAQKYRSDYKYYDQIGGWVKFHSIPASWHNAKLRCHAEGGILASPLNDEITSIMVSAMKQERMSTIYTGIHATYSKGDFFSMEGVPLRDIPKTGQNEFDQKDDEEDCMVMFPYGNLADVRCAAVYPYICYKKYDPLIPSSQNECGTVDSGYTFSKETGHCYKFHPIGQTWHRAFMICAAEGGYLAVINSAKEDKIIVDKFSKYPNGVGFFGIEQIVFNNAHIGFKGDGDTNFWMTIHGQSLKDAGPTTWGWGQPDNVTIPPKYVDYGPQECGNVFRNGPLDDNFCGVVAPFICEKDPESLKE